MKLLYLAFFVVGASAFYVDNESDAQKKERIVGGRKAPIESLPYQAQLLQNNVQICGASIISRLWILTAAHCITGKNPKFTVITGSASVSTGGDLHHVSEVIVHSEYDKNTQDNDIALLKLTKPIVYNERQKPIKLSTKPPNAGDLMTISGFGKKGEDQGYAIFLETANMPVVDHELCARRYIEDPITDNMFCAGVGPTDACQGDSGGPGVINGELAGVVSAGQDCGSTYYPGIYTTVYNYLNWIAQHTRTPTVRLTSRPTTAKLTSIVIDPSNTILGKIVHKFINFI
ncbi:trypsin-2-like [Nasonia vitripennis]|uniref:Peptidase S1 domain-containing protein n=1 Tax=Nasonia vitripennis TaxID=7425 RepID=A0A7M7M2J0_NASVI|nr:trypsin-2-like [Nasonia vitripennis]